MSETESLVYVCVSQHFVFVNICERGKAETKSIWALVWVPVCVLKLPESRRALEMNDETENFHSHSHVRGDLSRNQTLIQVKFWSLLL